MSLLLVENTQDDTATGARSRNEHSSGHRRPPDRPRKSVEFHLQRQAPDAVMPATRWPRRCWPTTRCWSAARSSTTARAASSPAARKSRTRWSIWARAARFEPNQRATTTELFDGLTATSQNHWPSLEFDVGVINNYASRFLPAGFYYKTFMSPARRLEACVRAVHPAVRRAGQGARHDRDADHYEHFYAHVDVLVVGGGIAGLQPRARPAASGARVLLVEQTAHWGGRAPVDGARDRRHGRRTTGSTRRSRRWKRWTMSRCAPATMGAGVYDHGYVLGYERLTDHDPADDRPRHRLWRIRAGQVITATGAIERPLSLCRQRHAGRDAGLGGARLRRSTTACRPATGPWSSPTTTTPIAPRLR